MNNLSIEEREEYINSKGFYLRDDRPIRENDPYFKGIEEAYSLHTINPFERYHVFGGPKEWAIKEAYKYVRRKELLEQINKKLEEDAKTRDWRKKITEEDWINLVNTLLDESDLQFDKGYRQGYIDAISNYAIWRNGEQFIGVIPRPLNEVIEEIKISDIPIKY